MMRKEITQARANTTKMAIMWGQKPQSDLEYAKEKWIGGYDEEGDYTGSGEYDANGNYVGEAPTEERHGSQRETGKVDTVRMAVMMEPANMTVTVIM